MHPQEGPDRWETTLFLTLVNLVSCGYFVNLLGPCLGFYIFAPTFSLGRLALDNFLSFLPPLATDPRLVEELSDTGGGMGEGGLHTDCLLVAL